jgi:hypothetical protein
MRTVVKTAFLAEARDFAHLQSVWMSSGVHTVSCAVDVGDRGVRHEPNHCLSSGAEVKNALLHTSP